MISIDDLKTTLKATLNTLKEHYTIIFIFISIAVFFICLHSIFVFWDNLAYMENAKYWAGQGNYFEALRPPLIQLVMTPFIFLGFGDKFAFGIFIILSLALAFFSLYKVAKLFSVDFELLLFLFLNPAMLLLGFFAGPELPAVALIIISIYMLTKNKNAGIFIGLATLLRYNAISYLILILLRPKPKDLLKNIAGFVIINLPWAIYCKIKYGNYFASILDSYAMNYFFRDYIVQKASISHFILNLNYIFIVAGFVLIVYFINKKADELNEEKKIVLIGALLITAITIYHYFSTPLKDPRYLLPLTASFVLLIGVTANSVDKSRLIDIKKICAFGLIVSLAIIPIAMQAKALNYSDSEPFFNNLREYKDCKVYSNFWLLANHYGFKAEPMPSDKNLFYSDISNGKAIGIEVERIKEPEYVNELNEKFNPNQDRIFAVVGENKCISSGYAINETYSSRLCRISEQCNDFCDYLSADAKWLCKTLNSLQ